ncbi:hypothetical protein U9M48_036988 [Paspalum notatum var. saurae]|uniref:Calmodulin-binding protein n=1 Tax=Paspalum notatum var. saurae TaxID=547442 RepID=A0AAQ3UE39_PASNO
MERGRGTGHQQPSAAKRARTTTVASRDGGDTSGSEAALSPGSSKLRPTFFVVLFAMRMCEMNPALPGTMFQRNLVRAFKYYQQITSREIQGLRHEVIQGQRQIENLSTQNQGLLHELVQTQRQVAHLICNLCANQNTRFEPNKEHAAGTGSNTTVCLRFSSNNLRMPVYTEKNIKDKNNEAIKVAIYEGGNVITSGPLSKEKIEILVLRGEFSKNENEAWSEDEFDNHIVQGRHGQTGLLGTVQLTNGEADLSQIHFKEPSYGKNVIMAARVCKGKKVASRVQEAIMNPVVVKHHRNEGNEKKYPPELDDDVFRLEEISKTGPYRKRLEKENISTVQEFLKAFNKDPNKLREILQMETKNNSWSNLTEHARQCDIGDRQELKRYQNEEGTVALFFNCVHDLVGADFGCGYVASCDFKTDDKVLMDRLKGRAYDELHNITPDYVLKDNIPEKISSRTSAAGPSVLERGTSQPFFSADQLTVSQGTGAAENSLRGGINQIDPTLFPNVNTVDDMLSLAGYLNMNDYQDHETSLFNQQPMTDLDSVMLGWQQNDVALMDSLAFFGVSMPAGEGACFGFSMGALQPPSVEYGQGPSCSVFPGSDPSNDCQ